MATRSNLKTPAALPSSDAVARKPARPRGRISICPGYSAVTNKYSPQSTSVKPPHFSCTHTLSILEAPIVFFHILISLNTVRGDDHLRDVVTAQWDAFLMQMTAQAIHVIMELLFKTTTMHRVQL